MEFLLLGYNNQDTCPMKRTCRKAYAYIYIYIHMIIVQLRHTYHSYDLNEFDLTLKRAGKCITQSSWL